MNARRLLMLLCLCPLIAVGQGTTGGKKQEDPPPDSALGGLMQMGKAVTDAYSSEDMKKEIYKPALEQWNAFLASLQAALEGTSLEKLAALEPQARAALKLLEKIDGGSDLADWLRERIEMIEVAKVMSESAPKKPIPLRATAPTAIRPKAVQPSRPQAQAQRPAAAPSRSSPAAVRPASPAAVRPSSSAAARPASPAARPVSPAARPASPAAMPAQPAVRSPVSAARQVSPPAAAAKPEPVSVTQMEELDPEAVIAAAAALAQEEEPTPVPTPVPAAPAPKPVAASPKPAIARAPVSTPIPEPVAKSPVSVASSEEAPMIRFSLPTHTPAVAPEPEAVPEVRQEPEPAPAPIAAAPRRQEPKRPAGVVSRPEPVLEPSAPIPAAPASVPAASRALSASVDIPGFDVWMTKLSKRRAPASAPTLIPPLRGIFSNVGTPADLVWLAEVESSLNPKAKSPVGAMGLFQLMPATAKELGLKVINPEERTQPDKSAKAAATYLKKLHKQLGDWPLAIAAYNAGPGRIRRTLTKENAKTFAEIAEVLPVETRLYVPKVLAMVNTRSGLTPEALAAIVVKY